MLMYVYMWCMMYIISIPPPQLDAGRLLILQSAGGKIIHVAWKGNHKFHDCKGNLNHLWIISEFLKLSETNKSWDISPNRGNWAKKGYSSDEPICSMYINIINKRKTPIVSGAMKNPWKSHENPMKTPIKHGTPGPKKSGEWPAEPSCSVNLRHAFWSLILPGGVQGMKMLSRVSWFITRMRVPVRWWSYGCTNIYVYIYNHDIYNIYIYVIHEHIITGWWLSYPSGKWWSESQLGWWHSQLNGKS